MDRCAKALLKFGVVLVFIGFFVGHPRVIQDFPFLAGWSGELLSNGLPILGYGGALATVPEIMFSCLVFWTGAVGMVVGSTISFWPEYDLIGNAMRMLGLLIVLPMLVQYFRTRAAGRSQK